MPPTATRSTSNLLVAKQWERAAIVYAFTHDARGDNRRQESGKADSSSFKEFAKLGIAGLTNVETVAEYRAAWAREVDAGTVEPAVPGARVTLPKGSFLATGITPAR